MKKINIILKRVIVSLALLTCVTGVVSCKSNSNVRDAKLDDTLQNVNVVQEGNIFKFTTSAIFNDSDDNIECLSYSEETTLEEDELENIVILDYEVDVDTDSMLVSLDITYTEDDMEYVDSTDGILMYNESDELDVLLDIDGEYVFATELLSECECVDEVGLFSKIRSALAKWANGIKIANSLMCALAYVEPALKLCLTASGNIEYLLLEAASDVVFLENYNHNLDLVHSYYANGNDFVYGQEYFTDWKFSASTLDYSGCEIIAGYNLCHALYLNTGDDKYNINLAETILAYEELGIEFNIAHGCFGSNPFQIGYFLEAMGITCENGAWYKPYVKSYDEFEALMNDSNDYYIIMSCWNQKGLGSLHTFMLDKDISSGYFYGYNVRTYDKYEKQHFVLKKSLSEWNKYFSVSNYPKETFICAYFIKK